ncbi:ClbS/DfsB family four-helix bundle protein [Enterococcus sp. S22(2020)]|uniref:ClbS/DfsB family four-helix bundle protein n=1 Tax=Enterococcus sp. S22(2020) TaxID=2759151 RepID=UPI001CE14996|nr:ClbS/DfsB family four-helix bundle protein [Enterococcus sp. S22(2020)]
MVRTCCPFFPPYETYGNYTLIEQRQLLKNSVDELCTRLEILSNEELFEPRQRKWKKLAVLK